MVTIVRFTSEILQYLKVADRLLPSPENSPGAKDDEIPNLYGREQQCTVNRSYFDCSFPDAEADIAKRINI